LYQDITLEDENVDKHNATYKLEIDNLIV